jgi:hypothetical protein
MCIKGRIGVQSLPYPCKEMLHDAENIQTADVFNTTKSQKHNVK